ncbi:MAG TPA: tetratricopeptide repeat protein [Burkholderiales bacterium]|nr:tetratricopeptide repeat protein [Burkholderiales bacterium]
MALLLLAAAPQAPAGEAEWKALYDQSNVHFQRGDIEQAEAFSREALREAERLGESNPALELSLLRTAYLLRLRGKAEEAAPLAERAVKVATRLYGAGDARTALALQNQGEIQFARKRYAESEALHRKALAIFMKAYGEQNFNTAVSLHNIGAMLYAQDKNQEAEKFLRRALAIKEKVLKRDSLSVAHTLDQLAAVLDSLGRQLEAERYRKRAAGIKQKVQSGKA